MADAGVKSTNITNRAPLIDEIIGNRAGSTVLQATQDLATQLAGSGALATAISALALAASADYTRISLSALNAVAGATNGQTGVVLVGNDRGVYERQAGAWVKVAGLPSDTGQAAAEAAAATALTYAQDADTRRAAAVTAAADAFATSQATLATEARINASTALITNDKGNWVTGVAYAARDVVQQSGIYYLCGVAHTAGTFATDLAAAKWSIWQGITAADLSTKSQPARGSALIGHRGDDVQKSLDRRQPELQLARLKTALASIVVNGTGKASLMVFGDSVARSLMSDEIFKSLWDVYGFRGIFASAVSAIGSTFGFSLGNLSGGTSSGAVTTESQWTKSPNGSIFTLSAAGHRVRLRALTGYGNPKVNRATLLYWKKPGGGTFKAQIIRAGATDYPIDVAGSEAVSTDAVSISLETLVVDFPTLEAGNELSVLWQSGGSVEVLGALVEDTTAAGLILSFVDKGGIDMQDTNTMQPAGLSTLLNLVAPDLITWGMKDPSVAPKLAAHQALWNGAYSTDWLYIAPYPDQSAGTVDAARAQAQPVIEHAVSNSYDYWDPLIDCPSYAYGVARGWFGDVTHLNPTALNAIGSRMWRATGLLPGLRAGSRTRNLKAPRAELDTLSVANRELIAHLRRLREASIVSAGRGVLMPAGTNTFASSLDTITPPGTGPFTMIALLRVPTSQVAVEAIGLRPDTAGGNKAGSVILQFRGAGQLDGRLNLQSADNATGVALSTGAGPEFWSRPGEIVMVGVRRDPSASLGSRYTVFVDGKTFGADAASAQTIMDQNIATSYLKVGAVSADIAASNLEIFGAAYYTSALSDSTMDLAAMSGAFPSGADAAWTFSEGSGRVLAAGASKRADLGSSARWLRPSLPRPSGNNSPATPLIANDRVIATRTGGGRMTGTLPATPVVGDFVEVAGFGEAFWRISQPALHQIVEGSTTSTVGTAGYIQSTGRFDRVRLECVLADTVTPQFVWSVVYKTGTLTWG
jgi:hypothetical protein